MKPTKTSKIIPAIFLCLCLGVHGTLPDLSNLPSCALTAALQYLAQHSDGCKVAQFECHCKSSKLISALPSVFRQACSAPEAKQARQWAVSECDKLGIPIHLSGDPSPLSPTASSASNSPEATKTSSTKSVLHSHTSQSMESIVSSTAPSSTATIVSSTTTVTTTSLATSMTQPSANTASGQIATAEGSTSTTIYAPASTQSDGGHHVRPTNSTPGLAPYEGLGVRKAGSHEYYVAGFVSLLISVALLVA